MQPTNVAMASTGAKWDLSRFGRLFVFFISLGFLCPNVWIEGMDVMSLHAKNDAGVER